MFHMRYLTSQKDLIILELEAILSFYAKELTHFLYFKTPLKVCLIRVRENVWSMDALHYLQSYCLISYLL